MSAAHNKNTPAQGSQISYSVGSHTKSYTVQNRLGSGGFADVYLCKSNETNRVYACKFIEKASIKSSKHFDKLKSEIQLHSLCGGDSASNEHVVPFKRYFENDAMLYIMIGYCPNGCLQGLLKRRRRLSEYETRFLMQQVSAGVHYLHSKFSIIHRDLKLANILLDENMNVKICDFGLAARLETGEQRKTTICGTPNYIAPEIASGINSGKNKQYGGHSYEVDIWSLGVMTFTMIFGVPPFQTNSIKDTLSRIKKSDFEFPTTSLISENAKRMIRGALHVDPKQRLNLAQLMRHAFFVSMPVPDKLPVSILTRAPTRQELFPDGINNAVANDKENQHAMADQKPTTGNAPLSAFSVRSGSLQSKMHSVSVHGVKFVDYSNRYGVGYILSNGCTGCYFNDSSSLILPINKGFLCYIDAKGTRTSYDYRAPPTHDAALSKKFAIFMQMAKILWKDFTVNGDSTKSKTMASAADVVYLRKTKPTEYALIKKFSNGLIQATFTDHTVVMIVLDAHRNASQFVFCQEKSNTFQVFDSFAEFKRVASKSTKLYLDHIQKTILQNC